MSTEAVVGIVGIVVFMLVFVGGLMWIMGLDEGRRE